VSSYHWSVLNKCVSECVLSIALGSIGTTTIAVVVVRLLCLHFCSGSFSFRKQLVLRSSLVVLRSQPPAFVAVVLNLSVHGFFGHRWWWLWFSLFSTNGFRFLFVRGVPMLVLFAVVAGCARFSPFGGLWFDFLDFGFLISFQFCWELQWSRFSDLHLRRQADYFGFYL
jgi:hypothetical protein